MTKKPATRANGFATPQKILFRVYSVIGQYFTAEAALTEGLRLKPERASEFTESSFPKGHEKHLFFTTDFFSDVFFGTALIEGTGQWAALLSIDKNAFDSAEAAQAWVDTRNKALSALGEPLGRWLIVKRMEPAGSNPQLR
jgi:hypothetical protein